MWPDGYWPGAEGGVPSPDPPGTRTVYMLLVDSQGQPRADVAGTLMISEMPQQLDTGHWILFTPRSSTSDAGGRIAWASVPIGAKVLLEVPAAHLYKVVTVAAGEGDQQV